MDPTSGYSAPNVSRHLIGVVDDGHHNLSVAPCQFDVGCKRKWKVSDHPGASLFLGGYSANELEEGSVDTGLGINLFSSSERRDEKRKKLTAIHKALVLGRSEPYLELSLSTCPSESAITTVNQGSIPFQDSATQLVDEGTTSSRWKLGPRLPPLQSTVTTTILSLVPSNGKTGPVIPHLSSSVTDALKNSVASGSGVTPQQQCRKSRVKRCQFAGCTTGSRGSSGFCIKHGGGSRCQEPGCNKGAEGKTMFCKGHGGGRRCHHPECTKSAEGRTDYCIGHGGGRRCSHDGCSHAARDNKSGFCIKHGGGKRCMMENCYKSAEGIKGLCISHGGGHRCQYINCTKGAQGSTKFCKAHGGGKRCTFSGCTKGAEGNTLLCKGHGGGKRCTFEGGCTKSVHSGCLFCVNHGGGKRCAMDDCTTGARGKTKFCVRHGGGKRCKNAGCAKSAQGSTDFCKRHGGGKRCSWAQSGLGDQAVAICDKLAKGKLGLCASHTSQLDNLRASHTSQLDNLRIHGGSATGPTVPYLQACLSKKTTGMYACENKHGKEQIQLQTPLSDNYLFKDCRPSQFSLPEGRVHGGSLMAMMWRDSASVGPSKDDNEVGCSLEPGSSHSLPHEWV